MPIEPAAEHPTFELGGNAITSFIAPDRGGLECVLYRVDTPPGLGLPPHHHDHLDTFLVVAGGGLWHMDDDVTELAIRDSVIVPVGVRHYLEAGPDGCSFLVTMLVDTKMFLDDGSVFVPTWVGSEHRS